MSAAFNHVLVASDGSPLADSAITLALRPGFAARITVLLVAHDYGLPEYVHAALLDRPDAEALREEALAEGRRSLDAAIARCAGGDVPVERRVVLSDRAPCHEIVAVAQREGCDLIVMAPHGRGGRLAGLLGSQTQAVMALARVPVLVAR